MASLLPTSGEEPKTKVNINNQIDQKNKQRIDQ